MAEDLGRDHRVLHDRLTGLAAASGALPPADLDPPLDHMVEQLRDAADGEFDQVWLDQQIDVHRRAVDLYDRQAARGTDDDALVLARDTLPLLRGHLEALSQSAGAGVAATQR